MAIDASRILKLKTRGAIMKFIIDNKLAYSEGRKGGKNTVSFDNKVCTFDANGKLLMIE